MTKFSQLTGSQKQAYIEQLNAAADMHEFLMILTRNFDMANCRPGSITKKILSQQMINTVMPMINPNVK